MQKRLTISIIMAVSIILSFAACGKQAEVSPSTEKNTVATTQIQQTVTSENPDKYKDAKLRLWINVLIGPDEQKNEQSEWVISKMLRKFEDAHPGLKVEMTVPPDQQAAHQTFKAAAMAKNGPDIANLWGGTPTYALSDLILHLDGKIPEEDMENLSGWDAQRLNFTSDGPILAYPARGIEYGCFIYNKKLVAAAGLDFENNAPKNVDEFMAAMEKLKATGIIPIVADDAGYNSLYVFCFGTWWAQTSGNERIVSNSLAKTKYVDDKGFIDTMAKAAEFYSKGYINKDYISSKESSNRFAQGKAALYCTGNWDIQYMADTLGEDNIGIIPVPQFSPEANSDIWATGGPGAQNLIIANYTKYPELAIELCSYLNNRENTLAFTKVISIIPLRKDISAKDIGWEGKPLFEKAFEIAKHMAFWTDNSQVPEVMNEYYKVGTMVLTGKMTAQEAAQKLDQKAVEVNK